MLKHSIVLFTAIASVSVSAVPIEERSTSAGYALFSEASAAAVLLAAQTAYTVGGGDKPTTFVSNNQTGTVSADTILKYGRYSGAAYKVLDTTWTCSINCKSADTKGTIVDYHWDTSKTLNPSYGFVAHKDDTKEIIVSWRGSTILMDWVKDFTFLPVSWPSSVSGSKVHKGFLQTYSSASSAIETAVAKLVAKYPTYSIVLTGHSLGGGEAAIAAADFATRHPEWRSKMKLFTFGEPRPFPIYRTVYKGDLVPRVPFQFMEFKHHSQEVWYDKNGDLDFQGSNGENANGQNSLTPLQWSVLDHLRYPGLSYELLYWAIGNIESIP
ncbi:hypothetical protein FBU59_001858 [Linderina macrospora]|uniref:Uncharacterized protein n=1 Tax=Linderina macrospora TaxID=4868 RepID=A0ACC1JD30_9FUNG|nr:hypothetical protein FBU59_001858 [Linderina macrospora]